MEFTTIKNIFEEDGYFDLEEEQPFIVGNDVEEEALPMLVDAAAWEQYVNKDMYEFEKRFRKWFELQIETDHRFATYRGERTLPFNQIFRLVMNREYVQKNDAKFVVPFSKVIAYYSSQIKSSYFSREKQRSVTKTAYVLSPKRLKLPPYSLKLRFEWLTEKGLVPNRRNMSLPKDDLKIGHARNPRTEENIRIRSERQKEIQREYQKKYRADHPKGKHEQ